MGLGHHFFISHLVFRDFELIYKDEYIETIGWHEMIAYYHLIVPNFIYLFFYDFLWVKNVPLEGLTWNNCSQQR